MVHFILLFGYYVKSLQVRENSTVKILTNCLVPRPRSRKLLPWSQHCRLLS